VLQLYTVRQKNTSFTMSYTKYSQSKMVTLVLWKI